MKNVGKLKTFGVLVLIGAGLLGAGLMFTGCKSTPSLTAAEAQALIQARYDQTAAVGTNIAVDDLGMRMGATDKFWVRTKIYPNKFWADFKLTADGKKALKLQDGSDVIQWRPESADDTHYSIVVVSVAANHLKARNVQDTQDDGGGKGAWFTEAVNLDGVPGPLQDIAHNPGNTLSHKRQAEFALDGGAWKLRSIN